MSLSPSTGEAEEVRSVLWQPTTPYYSWLGLVGLGYYQHLCNSTSSTHIVFKFSFRIVLQESPVLAVQDTLEQTEEYLPQLFLVRVRRPSIQDKLVTSVFSAGTIILPQPPEYYFEKNRRINAKADRFGKD